MIFAKLNSVLFYLSFLAFVGNIIAYFMGFVPMISAINYSLIICLFLGLMLTKNAPSILKIGIVGLITIGSLIWILAIFKIIDFAMFWKYGMLFIFSGIIWAVWNKVFSRGNNVLKIIFALSAISLLVTTVLTCFSYFDQSDTLFYSLLAFTVSAGLIMVTGKPSKTKNSLR
jgi:hypothetical protein